jgi:hypothetical protein
MGDFVGTLVANYLTHILLKKRLCMLCQPFLAFVHLHKKRFVEETILFAWISASWGRLPSAN